MIYRFNNPLMASINLATCAHDGQTDKGGFRYIGHLLRVLDRVAKVVPKDIEAQCAAVLHDVLEDTDLLYTGGVRECSRTQTTSYFVYERAL